MSHRIGKAELFDGRCRVPTTDDAHRVAVGNRLGHRFGPLVKRGHFKHTHRSVPYHRLGRRDDLRVTLGRLRPDVQAFPAVGDIASRNNLFVARAAKGIPAVGVGWQHQLARSGCNEFLGQGHLIGFHQTLARLAVLSQGERIGHRATDQDIVADAQQVLDDLDLVADLGTTQDGDEGSCGVADRVAQVLNLFGNQKAHHLGFVPHGQGYSDHRRFFAVAGSERIVAVDVCERGQSVGVRRLTIFFAWVESDVLEHQDLACLQGGDFGLCVRSNGIACKGDRLSEQLP